ncbi:No apical meristem (NAM) protein [Corchorus olitorius]|uniref:No apical meristem (NAM) protein n=1 Tax=Corchorus olitorius TaxID=93759 RepID=A0A1R3HKZ7_9ROSI|nr:No apical meristem (NAM) protein [Corchorus olitorius]
MNNIKGYGFRPSDEELIGYLEDITNNRDSLVQYITQLEDICEYEPWELPGLSALQPGCRVWYFVYSLNYKYHKGKLINRATKEGYWKPTGRRRKIMASGSNAVIGSKRSLTFHKGHHAGKTKNKKSNSTKHDNDKNNRNKTKQGSNKRNKATWKTFFLGKLIKQSEEVNILSNKGESSHSSPTNSRNQVAKNTTTPEDQSNSSKLFPEGEVSNDSSGVQNQSSTKEIDNHVQNDETYPQEGSNQDNFLNRIEVSNPASNLGNHAPVEAITEVKMDWGATSGCLITELEASKDSVFDQNQFSIRERGNLTENLIVVDSNITYPEERSNQHNIVAEHEGSNLLANLKNDDTKDFDPMDLFDYDLSNVDEVLIMIQTPDNCNMLQNQSSTNQQDAETKNSQFIENEFPCPEETKYLTIEPSRK